MYEQEIPEDVIAWMKGVLEDEGYTVSERGDVKRYAIQNDVSRLTLAAAKGGSTSETCSSATWPTKLP